MKKYDFEYDTAIYFNAADNSAHIVTNHPPTKLQLQVKCGAVDITKNSTDDYHVYTLPKCSIQVRTEKGFYQPLGRET